MKEMMNEKRNWTIMLMPPLRTARLQEIMIEKRNSSIMSEKEENMQKDENTSEYEEKIGEDRKGSAEEEINENKKDEGLNTCYYYVRGKYRHGLNGKIPCGYNDECAFKHPTPCHKYLNNGTHRLGKR